MSRAAWHLLCDIIEMPRISQYPDLLTPALRREMRSWTVVVDGAGTGKRWDVLKPNRAGMLAYHHFN
jgi:hypothetical protein